LLGTSWLSVRHCGSEEKPAPIQAQLSNSLHCHWVTTHKFT